MFDFVRKSQLWEALDADWYEALKGVAPFHLKTIQDVAVYNILKGVELSKIAEICGGNSRILPMISEVNDCYNIEKYEGADGGSKNKINISNVININTFVGEFSPLLDNLGLDILFSVSVVEHIAEDKLPSFFEDSVRLLRPGGIMIHAINIYVADTPSPYWLNRFALYKKALLETSSIEPIGPVYEGPLKFTCDLASNPDDVMHSWRRISPSMDQLRQSAQSVSLIWGARKIGINL